MTKVVIAHPFEFISAGMEAILVRSGSEVSAGWVEAEQALMAARSVRADVLILSRCLIEKSINGWPSKAQKGDFSGEIVLVLGQDDELTSKEFIRLAVTGVILNSSTCHDLVECVESVSNRRRWIDPHISSLSENMRNPILGWNELSDREFEVAKLAAGGFSNKEIARRLHVADGTVKMHMHHVLTKLHLSRRSDIIFNIKG